MSRPASPPGARPDRTHRPTAAEIGTAALRRFKATLTPDKMCGAKARSTGEPCRQVPKKGHKRCKFHGGATPKGDGPLGWHTRALPTDKPLGAMLKAAKRRKQRARVEAMTPEERDRYDEWQRTHKPGSAAARAQGRQNRAARKWLAGLAADSAPTSELAGLREASAKLRAEITRLEAQADEPAPPNVEDRAEGLFD